MAQTREPQRQPANAPQTKRYGGEEELNAVIQSAAVNRAGGVAGFAVAESGDFDGVDAVSHGSIFPPACGLHQTAM